MPNAPAPSSFTSADYAARMKRAANAAAEAGLAGVLIAPGPDLVWLTGYQPTAITERLTLLVITRERTPSHRSPEKRVPVSASQTT